MPAEKMSWLEVKDYFIGLRKEQVFFSYYRCLDCKLLYCPWYFSTDQLSTLYSEMPDNTMGEDKSTVSRTQSAYARWIFKNEIDNDSYLEIGPDIGLVAREVVKVSSPNKISLVEPNKAVWEELWENVKVVNEIEITDSVSNLIGKCFSLIAGIHVYDHLLDPVEDLMEVRLRSSSNGHLALVVHNESSGLRFLMQKKWPPFCLQHPQLYNPKTLANLLSAGGWNLIEVKRTSNWYHLKYFVKLGTSLIGLPSGISRIFPNIEFPIKLGNIIAIAHA